MEWSWFRFFCLLNYIDNVMCRNAKWWRLLLRPGVLLIIVIAYTCNKVAHLLNKIRVDMQFICRENREHIPPSNCTILLNTFFTPQSFSEQLREELFCKVSIWLKLSANYEQPSPSTNYQCNPLLPNQPPSLLPSSHLLSILVLMETPVERTLPLYKDKIQLMQLPLK